MEASHACVAAAGSSCEPDGLAATEGAGVAVSSDTTAFWESMAWGSVKQRKASRSKRRDWLSIARLKGSPKEKESPSRSSRDYKRLTHLEDVSPEPARLF